MNHQYQSTKSRKRLSQTTNQLITIDRAFKLFGKAIVFLYLIYLGKSAVGINLSDTYTMPDLLKVPFMALDCALPIEGNYCYRKEKKVSLQ